jgi:hypothetical protein
MLASSAWRRDWSSRRRGTFSPARGYGWGRRLRSRFSWPISSGWFDTDFSFPGIDADGADVGRDIARAPLAFIGDQAMVHNPTLFPLWSGGLVWLCGRARPYRVLGIAFIAVLAAFIGLKGKN